MSYIYFIKRNNYLKENTFNHNIIIYLRNSNFLFNDIGCNYHQILFYYIFSQVLYNYYKKYFISKKEKLMENPYQANKNSR